MSHITKRYGPWDFLQILIAHEEVFRLDEPPSLNDYHAKPQVYYKMFYSTFPMPYTHYYFLPE